MEYLALYRKWRPRRFADFVGQPHVVRTLRNAVAQNRVAHAYLFCGPRGTGKTTAAKLLARAVNCAEAVDGDPCGECPSCQRIAAGISLDVQEIDGASNRGIDEVRDLREKVKFVPAEGRFRVYIIDEVHMLTGEAFNALLKTLEEPPPQVIFVFATTEAHKLPATVLSRCQRFEFKRFSVAEIAGHLAVIARAEEIEIEPAALELLAVQASGGMRDAIGLLEQAAAHAGKKITRSDVREVLGLVDLEVYRRLALAAKDRDPGEALSVLAEVGAAGKDLAQFARGATTLWRDLLVLAVSRKPAPLQVIPPDDAATWRELAAAIGAERLLQAVEIFAATAADQKRIGEARLPLDLALIKLTAGIETLPAPAPRAAREERPTAGPHPAPGAPTAPKKARDLDTAAAAAKTPENAAWPMVQAKLRKVKPSLCALLAQHAQPQGCKGQAFVLRFTSKLFADKVEVDRGIVEQILAEVFGRTLALRCEVGPIEAEPAKQAPDPVAETVRLFDGVVEEE
ncbi:MAG: DNA polymerase III subunit gamma/tau [Bacteroidota bacterium]